MRYSSSAAQQFWRKKTGSNTVLARCPWWVLDGYGMVWEDCSVWTQLLKNNLATETFLTTSNVWVSCVHNNKTWIFCHHKFIKWCGLVIYTRCLQARGSSTVGVTSLALSPWDGDTFLVGSEGGLLLRCSFSCKTVAAVPSEGQSVTPRAPAVFSFRLRSGPVHSIHFSPFHRWQSCLPDPHGNISLVLGSYCEGEPAVTLFWLVSGTCLWVRGLMVWPTSTRCSRPTRCSLSEFQTPTCLRCSGLQPDHWFLLQPLDKVHDRFPLDNLIRVKLFY